MSSDFSGIQPRLQLRIHGAAGAPTLVYLPGLHGDWTLIGSFREALGNRVRFVEVAYSDTLTWSLEEHAIAVEIALREKGINRGWLLGESFGSQIAWIMISRQRFQSDGVILAGGFVRHPARWAANFAAWCTLKMPLALIKTMLRGYALLGPYRFQRYPETVACIRKYVESFTENRREALAYRLRLVAESDPCAGARQIETPVFALSGFWDPIVPWMAVRTWLKRNCSALRQYRIIWRADHNVLGTSAGAATELVLRWMGAQKCGA